MDGVGLGTELGSLATADGLLEGPLVGVVDGVGLGTELGSVATADGLLEGPLVGVLVGDWLEAELGLPDSVIGGGADGVNGTSVGLVLGNDDDRLVAVVGLKVVLG